MLLVQALFFSGAMIRGAFGEKEKERERERERERAGMRSGSIISTPW
jgi:hypothetical protein